MNNSANSLNLSACLWTLGGTKHSESPKLYMEMGLDMERSF